MSSWDFGYGRQEPADSREPADRREPRYPPPPHPGGQSYQEGNSYPGENGYPGDEAGRYDPRAAPYPLTYERDVFDGPVSGPAASPWSPGPRRAAVRPTSPGQAMPPRPYPRQATAGQGLQGQGLQGQGFPRQGFQAPAGSPPAPPWSNARPPAGRSGNERYTGGQPRYPAEGPGYAAEASGYPRRAVYGAGQAGDEPWLTGPRVPPRDGRWWDPDSWSGWQHWLIAVGVALVAALIGAALVLLTGPHHSAAAALPLPLIAAQYARPA